MNRGVFGRCSVAVLHLNMNGYYWLFRQYMHEVFLKREMPVARANRDRLLINFSTFCVIF